MLTTSGISMAMACLTFGVLATAQAPDVIMLDGQREWLHTNPLSDYLAQSSRGLPTNRSVSSANWRGYVATWDVRGDQLILTRIEVKLRDTSAAAAVGSTEPHDVLQSLFPGASEVPATWYTGNLIIPRGSIIRYVHLGYGSVYERYTILEVVSGTISGRRDMDAPEFEAFRRERFEAFKQTDAYAKYFRDSRDPASHERTERFLYDFAAEEYLRR